MEKQDLFMSEAPIWNPCNFDDPVVNPGPDQLTNCFSVHNWENSVDQSGVFESALSSIVSSPVATPFHGGGDGSMSTELLGKLGSVCKSDSNNVTSSYSSSSTLNSPPKQRLQLFDNSQINNKRLRLSHILAPIPADPEFAEPAARFSCFGNGLNPQFGSQLSQTSRSLKVNNGSHQVDGQESYKNSPRSGNSNSKAKFSGVKNAEFGGSKEGSSISEQIPGGKLRNSKGNNINHDANSRKRKSVPRNSDVKNAESSEKISKIDGDKNKEKDEKNGNQKETKENSKPEPPKDYIHVRARRGQATDSHSLAERVRREKISERMKFLQDLVPGCNKVTGKAVMLDEIINYVQSLQQQVEFLSMKLATVNPRIDPNVEALLSKAFQSRGSIPNALYPLDSAMSTFPYCFQQGLALQNCMPVGNKETQFSTNAIDPALDRIPSMQFPPIGEFSDSARQVLGIWEDDLHNVVQMGNSQNQQQIFPGSGTLYAGETKMEL